VRNLLYSAPPSLCDKRPGLGESQWCSPFAESPPTHSALFEGPPPFAYAKRGLPERVAGIACITQEGRCSRHQLQWRSREISCSQPSRRFCPVIVSRPTTLSIARVPTDSHARTSRRCNRDRGEGIRAWTRVDTGAAYPNWKTVETISDQGHRCLRPPQDNSQHSIAGLYCGLHYTETP
jgi:hypothetical protein